MPNFLVQDWDYLTSELQSIWNPEAVGGAGGSAGDVFYNAATGALTSDQIKSVCQQVYDNNIKAGATAAQAQAAFAQCARVASQPTGGTNLIWWAVGAIAAVVLINSI